MNLNNNIHVNPNFIKKSQANVHINPNFLSATSTQSQIQVLPQVGLQSNKKRLEYNKNQEPVLDVHSHSKYKTNANLSRYKKKGEDVPFNEPKDNIEPCPSTSYSRNYTGQAVISSESPQSFLKSRYSLKRVKDSSSQIAEQVRSYKIQQSSNISQSKNRKYINVNSQTSNTINLVNPITPKERNLNIKSINEMETKPNEMQKYKLNEKKCPILKQKDIKINNPKTSHSVVISNPESKVIPKVDPTHSKLDKSYAFKSRLKLIKNNKISLEKDQKGIFSPKISYAVKTKTKLIRNKPNFIANHKLVSSDQGSVISHTKLTKKCINSPILKLSPKKKYRLNNKFKHLSKPSKMKSKGNITFPTTSTSRFQGTSQSEIKRSKNLRSDKFVNISGQLYLSTRTSLKKHDLVKRKKLTSPKSSTISSTKHGIPGTSRGIKTRHCRRRSSYQAGYLIRIAQRKRRRMMMMRKPANRLCVFYHKFGRCRNKGNSCPFIHESNRKSAKAKLKSDRYVNISGQLYLSTRTSLKKHDLIDRKKTNSATPLISAPNKIGARSKCWKSKYPNHQKKLESGTLIEIVRRKRMMKWKRVNEFCFFYNKYGRCRNKGGRCPFIHDPNRVAVCTRFLQGSCTVTNCLFLHTLDKDRMPVCTHFLEGSCHRESCPYRHVHTNPKAPICQSFVRGHCPDGEECKKKHILICEEFKEKGVCSKGKTCPLSHRKTKTKVKMKKAKTKQPTKTRRRSKLGILGLEFSSVCDNTKVKKTRSKTNRYFEDSQSETDNTTTVDDSEASNTISPSLEATRGRLLKKIEKLKKNYNVGAEDTSLKPGLDVPKSYVPEKTELSSNSDVIVPQVSLATDLPSFIPLVFPNDGE